MSLSPEEIVDFPLKHAVRGYKVEQVDELLDKVADRIEQLERELETTRHTLSALESRLDESTETEATLKRTLVTAQRAAEETVADAQARATSIVSEAEERAEELVSEAERQADELRAATMQEMRAAEENGSRRREQIELRIARLRQLADDFERSLREHLERHRAQLEDLPTMEVPPPPADEAEPLVTSEEAYSPEPQGADMGFNEQPETPWSLGQEGHDQHSPEDYRA